MARNIDQNVFSNASAKAIQLLNGGIVPWFLPFERSTIPSQPKKNSGIKFEGATRLFLWIAAAEKPKLSSPYWATTLGGHRLDKIDPNCKGPSVKSGEISTKIPVLVGVDHDIWKEESLFNATQFNRVHGRLLENKPLPPLNPAAFLDSLGVRIDMGGNEVYYAEKPDIIRMPGEEHFDDDESFFGLAAAQLIRWAEHPKRMQSVVPRTNDFETEDSFHSLTASIGAAFLCADMGLVPDMSEASAKAEDLQEWIKLMKASPQAILMACEQAAKDVRHLFALRRASAPPRKIIKAHPAYEPEPVFEEVGAEEVQDFQTAEKIGAEEALLSEDEFEDFEEPAAFFRKNKHRLSRGTLRPMNFYKMIERTNTK